MVVRPSDPASAALLVVDMQPDFLPGGALAVADGDRVVEPIAMLMRSDAFRVRVATQDWHPPRHVSFASVHLGRRPFEVIELYGREQTLWPDHCVQGTPGAELLAALPREHIAAIIRKGLDPAVDSYSGFRNNWNAQGDRPSTGLAGYLHDLGVRDVYVCGLARDFCCRWTAEDAADAGFRTHMLWDVSRPVDSANDAHVRQALIARGVDFIDG